MDNHKQTKDGAVKGTYSSYIAGFLLSVFLTLTAFYLVGHDKAGAFSSAGLKAAIIILAVVQLFVQLLFFLHLDRESSPRWNLVVASFAASIVLILVIGSIWIMNNLNYHMDSPTRLDHSIIQDENVRTGN